MNFNDTTGKIIKWLLAIKVIIWMIVVFLPLDAPHFWRQSDTLGVAIRYWIRMSSMSFDYTILLPAVLNSGETSGIMPMEFPILNLLTSPFFNFGPYYGRVLARIFLFTINMLIVLKCFRLWKDSPNFMGVRMDHVSLATILVSISSTYFIKFMPDFTSMILVFLAVSFALITSKKLPFVGFATLGLLMKPPSIIVMGLLLLRDNKKFSIKKNFFWICLPIVVCGIYYTIGLKFIQSYSDGFTLFKTSLASPLDNLSSFFKNYDKVFILLVDSLIFIPGIILPILLLFSSKVKERVNLLFLLLLLLFQVLAVAALDGDHSFIHSYYYIGTAPTLIMIFLLSFRSIFEINFKFKKIAITLLLLSAVAKSGDRVFFEIRSLLPKVREEKILVKDCQMLKKRNPDFPWDQGYAFRSVVFPFPRLGNCFMEITDSLDAEYGIYKEGDVIPESCKIMDRESKLVITKCT